jgi:hypothetical protein
MTWNTINSKFVFEHTTSCRINNLLLQREATRAEVLCERLSLSLKGSERYSRELSNIISSAVKMLKKEVAGVYWIKYLEPSARAREPA